VSLETPHAAMSQAGSAFPPSFVRLAPGEESPRQDIVARTNSLVTVDTCP
jgi:hypothetical protein